MSVSSTLMTRLKVLLNSPQPWQELIDLLNGTSNSEAYGAYPSNVYTVDTTVAAPLPSQRVYPTVDAAYAAGTAAGGDFAINVLPGQVNTLNGPIVLDKSITIRCPYGGRAGAVNLPALLVNGGTGESLRFSNVTVGQAGLIADATGLDTIIFDDCRVISLGGQQVLGFAGVVATGDTQFVGTRFVSIGQNAPIGFVWSNSSWTPGAGFPAGATVFGMSASVVNSFIDCDVNARGIDDVTVFSRSLNNPTVSLRGTDIAVENSGGGNSILFDSALLTVELDNVQVTRTGAGVVNFGAGVVSPFPGLSWHGTDPNDALLPTGSWHNLAGTIVQVP